MKILDNIKKYIKTQKLIKELSKLQRKRAYLIYYGFSKSITIVNLEKQINKITEELNQW